MLLSAAGASFSSSSRPSSESGERVSVTVLLLRTNVSYSWVLDLPELADARFELDSALAFSSVSSILELVDAGFEGDDPPKSMEEMRELTEAFLELAEGLVLETSASSSSETASKLALSGTSV